MSLQAIAYLMHEAYLRILRLTQLTCQQAWQAVHEARKHYCHHNAELQQQQLAIAIGCHAEARQAMHAVGPRGCARTMCSISFGHVPCCTVTAFTPCDISRSCLGVQPVHLLC